MPPGLSPAHSPQRQRWPARLWQRPLGQHDGDFAQRYLIYLLCPILIGSLTYLTMRYLGVSHFPGYYKHHLLYHHRYALETAVNFGFWLYVFEEWISRLLGKWASRQHRTVGATCLLWSGGFGIAFLLQLTFIYERIDLYAPRILQFFDLYPLRRPSLMLRLVIFGTIWSATLSCRLAFGMLAQRFIEHHPQKRAPLGLPTITPGKTSNSPPWETNADLQTSTKHKPIFITTGNMVNAVQPESLASITSEGHYCRFILKSEDEKKEIFTRVALKDVIPELPSEDFIQIHRSHVVNRHYIERLKKSGRSYSLYIDGAESPLPISRYRWPEIRDRVDLS